MGRAWGESNEERASGHGSMGAREEGGRGSPDAGGKGVREPESCAHCAIRNAQDAHRGAGRRWKVACYPNRPWI